MFFELSLQSSSQIPSLLPHAQGTLRPMEYKTNHILLWQPTITSRSLGRPPSTKSSKYPKKLPEELPTTQKYSLHPEPTTRISPLHRQCHLYVHQHQDKQWPNRGCPAHTPTRNMILINPRHRPCRSPCSNHEKQRFSIWRYLLAVT